MATTLFYFNRDAASSHRDVHLRRELSLHESLVELPNNEHGFPPFLSEDWTLLSDTLENYIESIESKDEKSKAWGGILRLAFHDAMDFDEDNDNQGGSDGCIDTSSSENNALLVNNWSGTDPFPQWFKGVYDTHFNTKMSVADFWVASAIVALRKTQTHSSDTYFKFKWGRKDADEATCNTIRGEGRFPKMDSNDGCGTLDLIHGRLKLNWNDVVVLMGFHTLGVDEHGYFYSDSIENSLEFDKKYYHNIKDRGWSKSLPAGHPKASNAGTYFGWHLGGGSTRKMVMYPADLCLYYKEEDILAGTCCANTGNGNDCVDSHSTALSECTKHPATDARRIAMDSYIDAVPADVASFFSSFNTVFFKITSNGYSKNHLYSPWVNRTQVICRDMCQFQNKQGVTRECSIFEENPTNCRKNAKYCPATCGVYQPDNAPREYFPEKCYYEDLTPTVQYDLGCHGEIDE